MARWLDAHWEHSDLDMVPRADRLFGPYRQYEPDLVTSRPLSLSPGGQPRRRLHPPRTGLGTVGGLLARTRVLRRRPRR